eukprot:scaffold76392_cov52-Attheya_sp.AAC.3
MYFLPKNLFRRADDSSSSELDPLNPGRDDDDDDDSIRESVAEQLSEEENNADESSDVHVSYQLGKSLSRREKADLFDEQMDAAENLTEHIHDLSQEECDQYIRHSLYISDAGPKDKQFGDVPKLTFAVMMSISLLVVLGILGLVALGTAAVRPPLNPVGPYKLIERQGHDSAGSNGYITYVSSEKAFASGIANLTVESDIPDVYSKSSSGNTSDMEMNNAYTDDFLLDAETDDATRRGKSRTRKRERRDLQATTFDKQNGTVTEPFVYMGSAPTKEGPRDSIRLEGKRRFNRGLFILDLRHMPAGCGTWPAFWLTDEANWPVNGEIDIVEGINFQEVAKTALHSTRHCNMNDVPVGVKSGTWDTAVGIPNGKTGIPDMTMRYAQDCFVYTPKQWLNQGCVAVDLEGGTLGSPVNEKGGGVYALEWDPINRHIRTWVFSPHIKVPKNLRDSIRTAGEKNPEKEVVPDPDEWGLPYGYFPIGEES